MYYRQVSANGEDFDFPDGDTYTLAFSRILYGREVLVAYNISKDKRSDYMVVDASYHKEGDKLKFLYPGSLNDVSVNKSKNGTCNVQLNLGPHQFVILE